MCPQTQEHGLSSSSKILVVDDDTNIRSSLKTILSEAGHTVRLAESAITAMEVMREHPIDLLITDIKMEALSGLDLFKKVRKEFKNLPVLFISGNASLTEAVETIRLGCTDFLEKPFTEDRLLLAVERALRIAHLEKQLAQNSSNPTEMIGQTPVMTALTAQIDKVAPTKSKVLITGETGTGKELIARAIHERSGVSSGPFVKVNCAAIPEELIESELFGHERGAFTGAAQLKRGLFELAHGGTLFLDEIGEMSLGAQAKVLRVLQNQEFTRVGGSAVLSSDARILAATHQDLSQRVREGKFREDLFFRLNVIQIRSVPLREKPEDIPLLLTRFVEHFCRENGFAPKSVAPEVWDVLAHYPWPGNVRELKNQAERWVIFSGDRIELRDIADLAEHVPQQGAEATIPVGLSLQAFKQQAERTYILQTLRQAKGNVSQAAALLQTERTYLHRKIQEHGIQKKEYF